VDQQLEKQENIMIKLMDVITAQEIVILGKMKKIKWISIFCSVTLLVAVFDFPIEYYTFLRIVVFTGAILMIFSKYLKAHWIISFLIIAVLFNPIFPIYLREKSIWIPIDIISAICFLITGFIPPKRKDDQDQISSKGMSAFQRDKTFNK
jgi:hypothetical protein